MRKVTGYGGTGSAVLPTEEAAAPRPSSSVYRPANDPLRPRREVLDHFADDEETEGILRGNGRGRIRRSLVPRTRKSWIVTGLAVSLCLGAVAMGALSASQYLTRSAKFRIPSSRNIQTDGNSHLTRAQMLSVFGEDIEHNIFHVPAEQRRAQLEAMPWIEHATVMRLLPNRIRVHVEERVPVAFARQGGSIGLVDANGVLLDVPPDAPGAYAFPVVAGVRAEDSPAGRAERMKLYAAFLRDMDSDGKGASAQFSEIDLSDPEDVKALIPDGNNEVLIHFGAENFLARYRKFEDHIVEWRSQYPRLSSVDMRYERQVVLQMPQKDSTVVSAPAGEAAALLSRPAAKAGAAGTKATSLPASAKHVAPPPGAAPAARTASITTAGKAATSGKPARVATNSAAKVAATRKRVEAIKAWMAKRDKARAVAASAAGSGSKPAN